MKAQPMTVLSLLRQAQAQLEPFSPTARLDAQILLAHVLAWPRAQLLAERDYAPSPAECTAFASLVAQRATQIPVAYLVGHKEFYGIDLFVNEHTLVPRPETELLVDLVLSEARRRRRATPLTIADIGTGTGAIAVALAQHLPDALIYATDVSAEALTVAARNVRAHQLSERIILLQGDLLEPLPTPVDLLVSNPPYTILTEVDANVRDHEPHLALDGGGTDGADVYRRLLAAAPPYLRPNGAILLEIGAWQSQIVSDLIRNAFPQASLSLHRDLASHERVIYATLE